jgi:hypothetical protein
MGIEPLPDATQTPSLHLLENPADLFRAPDIGLNQKTVRPALPDFAQSCLVGTFILVVVNGYTGSAFCQLQRDTRPMPR